MKLQVEKKTAGIFQFTVETDANKKPMVVTLTEGQIDMLVKVLQSAKHAEVFRFQLEL